MDFYHFAKSMAYGVLKPLYRVEIIGREHFPKDGGVLLCTNHIDALDPPMVGITAPRPVNFMAKEELFNLPVLKGILPKVHAFPVKRGLSDRQALRTAVNLLKDDQVVGLFPEGTRNKTGKLGKGFSGAGFFALRGGNAVVVPCAIVGPYKIFRKLKIIYGEPIDMTSYRDSKTKPEEVTEVIMSHIQLLLDEHHPSNKK